MTFSVCQAVARHLPVALMLSTALILLLAAAFGHKPGGPSVGLAVRRNLLIGVSVAVLILTKHIGHPLPDPDGSARILYSQSPEWPGAALVTLILSFVALFIDRHRARSRKHFATLRGGKP